MQFVQLTIMLAIIQNESRDFIFDAYRAPIFLNCNDGLNLPFMMLNATD